MSTTEDQAKGKQLLQEVALRYASQHGLRPDHIAWDDLGYECGLKVISAEHTVRVVFSPDEIEVYAAEGAVDKDAKLKIRNAFASLSM
ncbi:MAG TPA: hypothetical protein VIR78_13275 [Malonomonas sp.]